MTLFFNGKTSLLLLALLPVASLGLSELPDNLFAYNTTSQDWDYCNLTYSDVCEPTVSIEQAACEADLVVFGLVQQVIDDATLPDYGDVQIKVEYFSPAFGDDKQKRGIPKWGAGLENPWEPERNTSNPFYRESGFFYTWVKGAFNNEAAAVDISTDGVSPCGTRFPRPQDELYFFLKALPDDSGEEPSIADNGDLNKDFTLATTTLRSGFAESIDTWDYVQKGIRDDMYRLFGDCQPVNCCYNPGCDTCSEVSNKYPNYRCGEWTPTAVEAAQESGAIGFGLTLSLLFTAVAAMLST